MCLCALTWSSASPVARNASNWARISAASRVRMPGAKKKRKRGASLISVEPAVLPHQTGRVRRAAIPARRRSGRDAARRAAPANGAPDHRVGGCRGGDHQARAGRRIPSRCACLDRLVDGDVAPEIVGADDQPPRVPFARSVSGVRRRTQSRSAAAAQPAISRWRRNWKNSTPSRSRRRIICGLVIISATSEAIFCRRK